MTEAIHSFFNIFPDWLHVLLISAVPIVELRGAIPYGILLLDMNAISVFLLSVAGSMIPAPFILFLAKWVIDKMLSSKNEKISRFADKVRAHGLKKSGKIEKYSYLGLFIFIAIPLPGTGVWLSLIHI